MKPAVFISGASKGIGLAAARKYYASGYRVGICARGEEALQLAKEEMPELVTFTCDMSEKAAVKNLARKINEEMGTLEVLVNNAGSYIPGSIHEEEDEAYEMMIRTNMDSAYYLTKGLLPAMKAAKKGAIVNIASIASLDAYPGGGSYSISKFALLGFSKNLRFEMKEFGIRVISVMPGAVLTNSWAAYDGPFDRLMPPEDIAEIIFTSTNLSNRTVVEDIVLRPQLGDL
ncbi:MAG: SDR family oxidoreductase [Bacteroidia bacterium]|nr:SDR family oxidoreductase [Bacteroidia bacterium]